MVRESERSAINRETTLNQSISPVLKRLRSSKAPRRFFMAAMLLVVSSMPLQDTNPPTRARVDTSQPQVDPTTGRVEEVEASSTAPNPFFFGQMAADNVPAITRPHSEPSRIPIHGTPPGQE